MKLLFEKCTYILLTICLSGELTSTRAVTVEETQADLQELANEFSEWKRQTIESLKTLKGKMGEELKMLNDKTDALSTQTQAIKSPPVGFIYIQYGGQAEPSNLWSNAVWEQVSSDYAGLFFRVEGGKSKTFGQTQYDDIGSFDIKKSFLSDGWLFRPPLPITITNSKGAFDSGDE